ncbi:MAG: hypothetical protein KatS3mg113_0129 [Planctomycetaceae bacterium]|nr:MAG: hypothetical protein KatS3mg113_0129 [Planctomycetaceae bacterium]
MIQVPIVIPDLGMSHSPPKLAPFTESVCLGYGLRGGMSCTRVGVTIHPRWILDGSPAVIASLEDAAE